MSEIQNILSESKFYNGKKQQLIIPVTLETGQQLSIENNQFYDIQLSDVWEQERTGSYYYYVYGKLNPVFNLKTLDNLEKKPTIETFSLNGLDNWRLLLLRPSSIEDTIFNIGEQSIDLTNGLPLLYTAPKIINNYNRIGLKMILGHDFSVGDTILITDTSNLDTKNYTVVDIVGNFIYINRTVTPETPNNDNVTLADYEKYPFTIFAKKIDGGIPRKYYIKRLRVIGICNRIDSLAFSKNQFNGDVFEFSFDTPMNVGYLDNNNYPMTNAYIGLVKTAKASNDTISDVWSQVSSVLPLGLSGIILDVISKPTNRVLDNVQVSDTLAYGLMSYDFYELRENMVSEVEHCFTLNQGENETIFSYLPFTKFKIRELSDYIDSSKRLTSIPDYAYFDSIRNEYRWRNVLNPGVLDADGRVFDLPFLNGAHYLYCDVLLNVKNYNSPKYQITELSDGIGSEVKNETASEIFKYWNSITIEDDITFVKPSDNVC